MAERRAVLAVAERVIDSDPAQVWSLLANPERVAEWAGLVTVGYMGTELPQTGHNVFVKRKYGRREPKRVEIESWDAGAGIRCLVHTEPEPTGFELTIHPEVESDRIETTVRLKQRFHVAPALVAVGSWWVTRQLEKKLDRIEKAVG